MFSKTAKKRAKTAHFAQKSAFFRRLRDAFSPLLQKKAEGAEPGGSRSAEAQ
jgi:hypothetical protein